MQSIRYFIRENRIRLESEMVGDNPHFDSGDNWQGYHYKVTLKRPGKQLTTFFSMGIGLDHEPTVEEVLDCLASDSCGIDCCTTFEEWCGNYGYDSDSRKAHRLYQAVKRQHGKLIAFLGRDLYKELIYQTERF